MDILKTQLQKSLQLREDLLFKIEDEEALLLLIEQLVQELIDKDFERFLRLLYRIDLDENKVKEKIAASEPEKATRGIAEMILNREKEKVASRAQYKEESPDWEF
ncbi:MAG: hypothetical protein H6579_00590 [Chitinophagales bacterium]|nr:hypothetical protein [Bacteroidota bacterium]MCB9255606.1 hypothetical protein [Chitinophagales bacterium]